MIISNASSNSSVDGPGPLICDVWFPWRWIWEGPRSSGSWNPSQRPEGDIMDVRQNDNVLIQEELTRLLARACWEVSDLAKAFYFLVPYSAISRVYLCTAREFLFIQVSTKYPPSQSSKSGSSWLQNQHRRPARMNWWSHMFQLVLVCKFFNSREWKQIYFTDEMDEITSWVTHNHCSLRKLRPNNIVMPHLLETFMHRLSIWWWWWFDSMSRMLTSFPSIFPHHSRIVKEIRRGLILCVS